MMTEQKTTWGVVLQAQPFTDRPTLTITVEVSKPVGTRNPAIKSYFRGVPQTESLGRHELAVWINAFHAMLAKADQTAAAYAKMKKPPKPRKRPKK